ncbi:MAG: mandelate racemase/muconate lactonizing enzyme family protein [Gammaproteobacteria bacterium]|nr:mandelate racemase/muconate lactonizing enzyme family protein [Gammaproteobacteria bacterium]
MSDTIITGIETLRLSSYGNLLWVKVHTDAGQYGLGETFLGPESVEAHIHETIAPYLLGKNPLQRDLHWKQLRGYLGFRSSGAEMRALSAIDIALWDLWGKMSDTPLYNLLGGKSRDSIRVYNTCAGYTYIRNREGQKTSNWGINKDEPQGPYEDLDAFLNRADELAHSLLDEGITAMKIWPFDFAAERSLGNDITAEELNTALLPFEKIRKAVGDKIDIMVECHSLWNLNAAIKISRALEQFSPYFIEDPIKADSLENLAEFRSRTSIPVCASETLATRWGYRDLLEARAADIAMPDLGWVGGVSEAKKIASMAEAFGVPVAPHDCTGPVVWAASVHLSLNAVNAVFQESVRALYTGWYTDVVTNLPVVENGMVSVADKPGLGIELLPDIDKRDDAVVRISSV